MQSSSTEVLETLEGDSGSPRARNACAFPQNKMHEAIARRIAWAASWHRRAVTGPWTTENGPELAGIRNIKNTQIDATMMNVRVMEKGSTVYRLVLL